MQSLTPWDHVVAAIVGIGIPVSSALPWLLRRDRPAPPAMSTRDKITLYWSNGIGLLGLAAGAVYVWTHAGRSLAELGLTAVPRRLPEGLALAAVFLALFALDTWWELSSAERLQATRARWRRDTPFMPASPREVRHSMVLIGCAAVGEEILFRGWLIGYLTHLTGTTPSGLAAAVALPAVVFALAHAYQRGHAMVKIAALSCIFGAIFVITGSLWIPVALHFVVDLVGSLLGPRLLPASSSMLADPAREPEPGS